MTSAIQALKIQPVRSRQLLNEDCKAAAARTEELKLSPVPKAAIMCVSLTEGSLTQSRVILDFSFSPRMSESWTDS